MTPSGPGKSVTIARVSLWPHMISREGRERSEWTRGLGEDTMTFPMTRCRATFKRNLLNLIKGWTFVPRYHIASIDMIFSEGGILQISIIHFIYLEKHGPELFVLIAQKLAEDFSWWQENNQHVWLMTSKQRASLWKKCHSGQISIFAYSDTLLINDLGLAKSVTVARLSL